MEFIPPPIALSWPSSFILLHGANHQPFKAPYSTESEYFLHMKKKKKTM